MSKTSDHIERLQKMRAQQVEERRAVSLKYEEAAKSFEIIEKISEIQSRIDALDRAIADEKNAPKESRSWVGAV